MFRKICFLAVILIMLLGACNLPTAAQGNGNNGDQPNASTQAAQTVEALLTSQAVQVPPQNTATLAPINNAPPTNTLIPLPTNTLIPPATATQNCDAMKFIADVTVPDGTVMTPGQTFTKTWRIQNTGTCSWTPSYANVFSSGNAMGGPSTQALAGNVNPGGTVDISMNFTAPGSNGNYTAYYKLRNAAGVLFGQFYVQIKVDSGGGSGGGPFAVTSVNISVDPTGYTGPCTDSGGKHITTNYTAQITANGAGDVTYKWVRSDTSSLSLVTPHTITFASAGTQTVTTTWDTWWNPGDNETIWEKIYIDEPNHQYFSAANTTIKCDP